MSAYVGPRNVLVSVLLIAAGSVLAFGTSALLASLFPELSRDLRVALGYISLLVPLAVFYRAHPELFGFRRERLVISTASGLVLAFITLLGFGKWSTLASGLSGEQISALLLFALVALFEEGIFRGVLQTQLTSWLGRWSGLIGGALLFSLWHIPQRLVTGQTGADLVGSLGAAFATGAVLGLLMLTFRNAVSPAILHTAVNWVDRL